MNSYFSNFFLIEIMFTYKCDKNRKIKKYEDTILKERTEGESWNAWGISAHDFNIKQ